MDKETCQKCAEWNSDEMPNPYFMDCTDITCQKVKIVLNASSVKRLGEVGETNK